MKLPQALTLIADTLWLIEPHDRESALQDLLTPSELIELGERVAILRQLSEGKTQRQIAKDLGVSVTTVSRGARVLAHGSGAIRHYLE